MVVEKGRKGIKDMKFGKNENVKMLNAKHTRDSNLGKKIF